MTLVSDTMTMTDPRMTVTAKTDGKLIGSSASAQPRASGGMGFTEVGAA